MTAASQIAYGDPGTVIKIAELPMPKPGPGEVLVKVHAASVNAFDRRRLQPDPGIMRFSLGIAKPVSPQIGGDFAGEVVACGEGVTDFKTGDKVLGDVADSHASAFAEYVTAPTETIIHKPGNISFLQAATVSVSGVTALLGLQKAKLAQGNAVLVNGASGAVGTFAVQLARALGAKTVSAVCSGKNAQQAKALGADSVIDYRKQDIASVAERFDVVLDVVGNLTAGQLRTLLNPQGHAAVVGFTSIWHLLKLNLFGGAQVSMVSTKTNKASLQALADLLATERIKPAIEKVFPLEQTAAALAHVFTGHASGKIAISIYNADQY